MIWAHLIILGLTAILIVMTDLYGLLWIKGRKETLNLSFLTWSHRLIWLGLLGMIATGALMAYPYISALATIPLYLGKMFFVLLLVINAFLIGKHMHIAAESSWKELDQKVKIKLIASGLVSTTSWLGAFVLAKILF